MDVNSWLNVELSPELTQAHSQSDFIPVPSLGIIAITSVVVCTELWGKELYRQVGVGIVVISGSLCDAVLAQWLGMPGTWVESRSRHIISHFCDTHDTGSMTRILYKLCTVWLFNLPYVCICKDIASMYVIVSIIIPGRWV